jgi:hypothetical protein
MCLNIGCILYEIYNRNPQYYRCQVVDRAFDAAEDDQSGDDAFCCLGRTIQHDCVELNAVILRSIHTRWVNRAGTS